ncbi:hypothetical protein, partial [Sedimentitalea sp.]|uniref:hypothetical protein n=1 Tax=Sedimentitalea sp. TaxID=2048915 RepID=UPI003298CB6B
RVLACGQRALAHVSYMESTRAKAPLNRDQTDQFYTGKLTHFAPGLTGSTPSVECADQLRAAGVTLSQINLSGPNGRAVVAYPIELPKRYDGYSLWTE